MYTINADVTLGGLPATTPLLFAFFVHRRQRRGVWTLRRLFVLSLLRGVPLFVGPVGRAARLAIGRSNLRAD